MLATSGQPASLDPATLEAITEFHGLGHEQLCSPKMVVDRARWNVEG